MTGSRQVVLPTNLTISNLKDLHDEMEVMIEKNDFDNVSIEAKNVERVDTAGIQLLLAFKKSLKEREIAINWQHPTEQLRTAAAMLGLDEKLRFNG